MRKGGVDVLLPDLVLPDIDGLKILGELASRGDTTPVVMVSGQGQTELAVKALRAGAVDCVHKATPQFLRMPDIAKRQYERRKSEPAVARVGADPNRRHKVALIETSFSVRRDIRDSFARGAPQIELRTLKSPAELDADAFAADAVVIGPEPGGAPSRSSGS